MSEKVNFAEELAAATKKSVAPRNRVAILLEELHETDTLNYEAVKAAVDNKSISNASITRTIKNIWGDDAVTNTSVRDYRVQNGII